MSDAESSQQRQGDEDGALAPFNTDLLELILDPVLVVDQEERVTAFNAAAERLLACVLQVSVGALLRNILPDCEPLSAAIRTAFAGRAVAPFEMPFPQDMLVEARLKRTGSALLVYLRDISLIRQLETALRESDRRFHDLADNITEIFWLRDADTGETLYISPSHEAIYGVSLDRAYANRWSFLDTIHPDDRALFTGGGQTKTHPYFEAEYRVLRPDGAVCWASARTFPIYNAAGEIYRLGGVITDITERKLLDTERTKRLIQLQELADAAFRINASISIEDILNIITQELRIIVGAHQAMIALTQTGPEPAVIATSLSEKYAAWAGYAGLPNNQGIYSMVVEEKRVFRMTQAELEAHSRFHRFSGEAGKHPPLNGWLAAPILGQNGDVIGILQLSDKVKGEFTEEDEVLLSQLAQLAAISLTKARLFEAERRARMIADTLQSANSAINQALGLQPILELLLDYLGQLVPYDGANVMLLEADDSFHARAAKGYVGWGLPTAAPDWVLDPRLHPLIGRLYESRQPIRIDDVTQEPGWYAHPDTPQVRCWMGMPLVVENTVIGLYSLDSVTANAFTDEHLQLARALAAPAAFAIQKALLFNQVRNYAIELEQRVQERTSELVKANRQLEAMNQAKAKFVSDVSHELRNPIASLSLSFELMKRRTRDQVIERLPDLQEPIDLLLKLTNEILDISRLDLARGKAVAFTAVDLGDVVAKVVEAYRPAAEVAGLVMSLSIEPHLPSVRGEPNQLSQVVTNLVSNAIKYTPSGRVDVYVRLDTTSGMMALVVNDTGLGIEDEDMPHLFERFYRGNKVRQTTIPGTGLGLPIVQDVVHIHSGSIHVESEAGAGSCFTVLLPLAGLD